MAAPTALDVTFPANFGFVPAGTDLTVRVDGALPAAGKVGVLIRVFYRINGIPFAHELFNGPGNTNGQLFTNAPLGGGNDLTIPFSPLVMFHSLRATAWGRVAGGAAATGGADIANVKKDVKSTLTRFQGIKVS
jgi:hypothetical protein